MNGEMYAFVVDAGEDRVVCVGSSTTIGGNPTADNSTNPSYTYKWDNAETLSCGGCPDPTIIPNPTASPTETTTYKVTVIDGGGFVCTEEVLIEVTEITIFELSFSENHTIVRDDGLVEYTAPHWKDNSSPLDGDADDNPSDVKHPICYNSGQNLEVSARFKTDILTLPSIVPLPIKVRGMCSDGIEIPSTEASYNSVLYTIDLSNAVSTALTANKVNYYNPFEIQWEISFDGGSTWCSAGVTKNPLYVTLGEPLQPYTPPTITGDTPFEEVKLFHTLVHHGCTNAKNAIDSTEVLNNVWQDFTNREVRRVDGTQMTYYKNYQCVSTTTNTILKTGDGQCGSWSRLFLDILKAQGIDYQNEYIIVATNPNLANKANLLFIKKWSFDANGGTSGNNNLPFLNTFAGGEPPISNNTYNWIYSEVNDVEGEPGQGTPNPASIFGNHQIVLINGTYYDPSYGQSYDSLSDFDLIAIEAFAKLEEVNNENSYFIKVNNDLGMQIFDTKINY